MRYRLILGCGLLFATAGTADAQSLFEEIATQKRDEKVLYPLGEAQGPFMVRAASFVGSGGLTHANALARELRTSHGVEAFVFVYQPPEVDQRLKEYVEWHEARYKVKPRTTRIIPKPPNYLVVAGNYGSMGDPALQAMRERLAALQPTSVPAGVWQSQQVMGVRVDPRLPLRRAVGCRNPLRPTLPPLPDEESVRGMLAVNDNEPFSIYKAPADSTHTLLVANFRAPAQVVNERGGDIRVGVVEKVKQLWNGDGKTRSYDLNSAGENAVKLTGFLRANGFDAYVFHGEKASVVYVGAYPNGGDPRITEDLDRLATLKFGGLAAGQELVLAPKRPSLEALAAEQRRRQELEAHYRQLQAAN